MVLFLLGQHFGHQPTMPQRGSKGSLPSSSTAAKARAEAATCRTRRSGRAPGFSHEGEAPPALGSPQATKEPSPEHHSESWKKKWNPKNDLFKLIPKTQLEKKQWETQWETQLENPSSKTQLEKMFPQFLFPQQLRWL